MRTTRRGAWITLLVVMGALASVAPADALLISQIQPFTANGPFGAVAVSPFDPALGTLDSVSVNISGTLAVTGLTPANVITIPPGVVIPMPYSFGISVDQDYFGLAGKYFDFLSPAEFMLFGTATGAPGSTFALTTNYSFDFDVTATTDLIGFVFPTTTTTAGALIPPLSGIDARRSDFLATGVPIDEIDLIQTASPFFSSGPQPIVTSLFSTGLLSIDYQYTPVARVSGPATLLLLGAGVAGLIAIRRR